MLRGAGIFALVVLCAAGCKHDDSKATTMTYLPTAQLVTEIKKADQTPTSGMTDSLPIPVLRDHRLLIAVFQAAAGYDPDKGQSTLSSPERVVFFDPTTGARVTEDKLSPARTLGDEAFAVPRSDHAQLSARLFGAYDVLLPAFAQSRAAADPALQAAAKTYKQLFPRFAGALLAPYYEQLGADWFAWIDRMAAA